MGLTTEIQSPADSRHVVPATSARDFELALINALRAHNAPWAVVASEPQQISAGNESKGAAVFSLLEDQHTTCMTPTSLSARTGTVSGYFFGELCAWMIEDAVMQSLNQTRLNPPSLGKTDPAPQRWAWRMQRLNLLTPTPVRVAPGWPLCLANMTGGEQFTSRTSTARTSFFRFYANARTASSPRPEFQWSS